MIGVGSLRLTWLLLLVGIVIFSIATIIAEPFEQETAEGLSAAIASGLSLYRTINVLATVGLILIFIGFARLAAHIRRANRNVFIGCIVLFAVGLIFWFAEIIARLTTVASSAQAAGGSAVPQSGLGIGFDVFFLGFLASSLLGTALLVWGLGQAGVLSPRLAAIASLVVLTSGIVAAIFYPWVGGVERVFFYPLFLVVLPMSIFFIVRRRQPAMGMTA